MTDGDLAVDDADGSWSSQTGFARSALGWSRRTLRPEFRGPGKSVGLEVAVPSDAPAYDRLAGWFGRDPGWTPARAGAGPRPA